MPGLVPGISLDKSLPSPGTGVDGRNVDPPGLSRGLAMTGRMDRAGGAGIADVSGSLQGRPLRFSEQERTGSGAGPGAGPRLAGAVFGDRLRRRHPIRRRAVEVEEAAHAFTDDLVAQRRVETPEHLVEDRRGLGIGA